MVAQDHMTPRNGPVMADVARAAGVSHMTVSRVLSGKDSVRPDTRQRVLDAVRELKYQRNDLARALAAGKSDIVGYIAASSLLRGPSEAMYGFIEAAALADIDVTMAACRGSSPLEVKRTIERMSRQGVDGIAVYAPHSIAELGQLDTTVPILLIGSQATETTSSLLFDQTRAASLAMDHMLDLGHREIWHIAAPRDWNLPHREDVWRSSLDRTAGAHGEIMYGDWSPASGYEHARVIAREPRVSGIFVASDRMALGALYALAEAGRRVPEDISVIGFDDIGESAYYQPALTTVRQDGHAVGARAFAKLSKAISTGRPVHDSFQPPAQLVRRLSTARHDVP